MRTLEKLVVGARDVASGDGLLDTAYSTEDYQIAIGFPTEEFSKEKQLVYAIVNKFTGVIEKADSILPHAIAVMAAIQEHLDAHRKESVNKAFAAGKRPIVTN